MRVLCSPSSAISHEETDGWHGFFNVIRTKSLSNDSQPCCLLWSRHCRRPAKATRTHDTLWRLHNERWDTLRCLSSVGPFTAENTPLLFALAIAEVLPWLSQTWFRYVLLLQDLWYKVLKEWGWFWSIFFFSSAKKTSETSQPFPTPFFNKKKNPKTVL